MFCIFWTKLCVILAWTGDKSSRAQAKVDTHRYKDKHTQTQAMTIPVGQKASDKNSYQMPFTKDKIMIIQMIS